MDSSDIKVQPDLGADEVRDGDLAMMTEDLDADLRRMSGKRVLITGGAGFLGYYLVQVPLAWNDAHPDEPAIGVTVLDNFFRETPVWLKELERRPEIQPLRQEQAAALQRLGQLARVIGGQEHQRGLGRGDRAKLGNRHLVVGEDLEQQRLGLYLEAVNLVDEQDNWLRRPDRRQQRPRQQELLAEDVRLQAGPRGLGQAGLAVGLPGLDPEQLLLVVPLVEGLGLVETLVALQPDQPHAGHLRDALGQLGLSGTGRALDEHRLSQLLAQVHHTGDVLFGR